MRSNHILVVVLSAIAAVAMQGCGSSVGTVVGPTGAQGLTGNNGTGCSVALVPVSPSFPVGGSLITCGDGSSTVVLNGLNGTVGAIGATGQTGAVGNPGTVFTPIKFCGSNNSYPNTFTEDGFCFGGKMYGVMSVNSGFLTELPPGKYTSNGINSSCTFTIGANCSVTH